MMTKHGEIREDATPPEKSETLKAARQVGKTAQQAAWVELEDHLTKRAADKAKDSLGK
jgi:hypothetical protein